MLPCLELFPLLLFNCVLPSVWHSSVLCFPFAFAIASWPVRLLARSPFSGYMRLVCYLCPDSPSVGSIVAFCLFPLAVHLSLHHLKVSHLCWVWSSKYRLQIFIDVFSNIITKLIYPLDPSRRNPSKFWKAKTNYRQWFCLYLVAFLSSRNLNWLYGWKGSFMGEDFPHPR